ncbi:MAG: hypothetical protein GYA24_09955 [Candidatus Lokiarchaeota archaeon]|nr:hypothetical protein [Candidatus Lokiarchaeota archaeon]
MCLDESFKSRARVPPPWYAGSGVQEGAAAADRGNEDCLIWNLVNDPQFKSQILGRDKNKVLRVSILSERASCLSCEFILIELVIRCALLGIDLQVNFLSLYQPEKQDQGIFEKYKDVFKERMEKILNEFPSD